MNQTERKSITLGELAEAIANGRLKANRNDQYYTVKLRDVVKLTRLAQQLPIEQRHEELELALAS